MTQLELQIEELPDGGARITVVSPNQPRTPIHSVRIDHELWNAAKTKAEAEDRTITDVIREMLWTYVAGE